MRGIEGRGGCRRPGVRNGRSRGHRLLAPRDSLILCVASFRAPKRNAKAIGPTGGRAARWSSPAVRTASGIARPPRGQFGPIRGVRWRVLDSRRLPRWHRRCAQRAFGLAPPDRGPRAPVDGHALPPSVGRFALRRAISAVTAAWRASSCSRASRRRLVRPVADPDGLRPDAPQVQDLEPTMRCTEPAQEGPEIVATTFVWKRGAPPDTRRTRR